MAVPVHYVPLCSPTSESISESPVCAHAALNNVRLARRAPCNVRVGSLWMHALITLQVDLVGIVAAEMDQITVGYIQPAVIRTEFANLTEVVRLEGQGETGEGVSCISDAFAKFLELIVLLV